MFVYFRADKKFSVSMSSGSNEADPNSEALKIRREKILSELIMTECRYVDDLEQVNKLVHFVLCENYFTLNQ